MGLAIRDVSASDPAYYRKKRAAEKRGGSHEQ